MQSDFQSASTFLPASSAEFPYSRKTEDRIYQAFTVASILLVLASLWIF
jgi:hypothetical protein